MTNDPPDPDWLEANSKTVRLSIANLEIKSIPLICPWCNQIFKVSKWEIEYGRKTGASHGICPACYQKQLDELHAKNKDDQGQKPPHA